MIGLQDSTPGGWLDSSGWLGSGWFLAEELRN
jgi:hypothetical protein